MSKRTANFLTGGIILGLIVAIIALFVSPTFQAWAQIWLAHPDGLAASATTVAAIATLFAVIVGLRGIYIGRELAHEAFLQTEKARDESRLQFLEAGYNDSRPLLVPVVADATELYEADDPIAFDWDQNLFTTIQNLGTGIATNIWIALLPPPALLERDHQHVFRLGTPIAPGSGPLKVHLSQGVTLFAESDKIGEYPLCLPADRVTGLSARSNHFIARLSITYHDIFGRKHASIFDLSDRGIWVNVAFVANIERDLGEIDAVKVDNDKYTNVKVEA